MAEVKSRIIDGGRKGGRRWSGRRWVCVAEILVVWFGGALFTRKVDSHRELVSVFKGGDFPMCFNHPRNHAIGSS